VNPVQNNVGGNSKNSVVKSDRKKAPKQEQHSGSATIRIIAACLLRRRLLENADAKFKSDSLDDDSRAREITKPATP